MPQKNMTESAKLDDKSILFIRNILPDDVDSRKLEVGGTQANIDGFLDCLCPDGTAYERIVVQVKHLTYPPKDGDAFYDIPLSIYAYSERHPGEVVVFIAASPENEIFYWRYIDSRAIEEYKNHSEHIRQTIRYHFKPEEACTKDNVKESVLRWKQMYRERMASIKDERQMAETFAASQRLAFNSISSELQGLANSYIPRKESELLYEWASGAVSSEQKSIRLLVGDAGQGKSVVIKNLIERLEAQGLNCLCLKADALVYKSDFQERLYNSIAFYTSNDKHIILIVDQIDALSQSLSADRALLNTILSVLAFVAEMQNVRVLVSCRKYDLEYDAVLSTLKDKSEIVELGLLSEENVKSALESLESGLSERIGIETLSILRNVQYLNSFCYLYRRNNKRLDYSNLIEIYDALWDIAMDGLPSEERRKDAEKLIFAIAECIRNSETLKPMWQAPTELREVFSYLASNGILMPDGNAVSFMHQTFYDYVLARMYLSQHKSFVSDIESEFQGLEIRSTVKAVLDYLRGHNELEYASEIQQLFSSGKIRLHIKLLAISILASANDPRQVEKRIVKTICLEDKRLCIHFFKGVQSEKWFSSALLLWRSLLPDALMGSQLLFAMVKALSRYSYTHPDQVYTLLDSINDEKTRNFSRMILFQGHNDYSYQKVIEEYRKLDNKSYLLVRCILDATQSNVEFALNEVGSLLLNYLEADEKADNPDGYELMQVMGKKLCRYYPEKFLSVLHQVFVKYVRENASDGYYGFSITPVFDSFSLKEYSKNFLELYKGLIIDYSANPKIILPIVDTLLSLNNRSSFAIAFIAIAAQPELYYEIIEAILADSSLIEKFLQRYVNYYFLQMLKAWYLTLDKKKAEAYQKYILSYVSSAEFSAKSEQDLAFPNLWREKWLLICNTLPNSGLIPEMKKCVGELHRRFGRKCILDEPHNEIKCYSCGGLVSDAVYKTFSKKAWLNSFLALDDTRYNNKHVSLSEHSEAFKKCVAAKPSKFKAFVFEIACRPDVKPCYVISGIEELLEAGIEYEILWPLASRYLTVEYASENICYFEELAKYFIRTDNKFIDQLIPILLEIINRPFEARLDNGQYDGTCRDISNLLNDMLIRGANSKQGYALRLLCQLSDLPERRKQVYDELYKCISSLSECLRLLPLHYLYDKVRFVDSLYYPLLQKCLEYMGPEALLLCESAIQWCFYYRTDIVNAYISRVEGIRSSHKILSQIYYYGLAVDVQKTRCLDLLERILEQDEEEVVEIIVELAMKTFLDADYTNYARMYLERYASDDRENVVKIYSLYCDNLPVEAFSFYRELAKRRTKIKGRDIISELKYLTKCIASDPVGCYKFIEEQRYDYLESTMESKVLEVMLKIYGRLKEEDDENALNEIMDVFDVLILNGNDILTSAVKMLDYNHN